MMQGSPSKGEELRGEEDLTSPVARISPSWHACVAFTCKAVSSAFLLMPVYFAWEESLTFSGLE